MSTDAAHSSEPSTVAATAYRHRRESSRPSGASRKIRAIAAIDSWPPSRDDTQPAIPARFAGPGPFSSITQML